MAKMTSKVSNQDDFGRRLVKAMEDFIADESKVIVAKHLKEMEAELERKRADMISRAMIMITRYTEVNYMHDRIIFTIKKDGKEPF